MKTFIVFVLFLLFIGISFFLNFLPGKAVGDNFFSFTMEMVKVLPAVFILIGLFDVWVKRETIEKHLGDGGGVKSFLWVFLLAAPMAGGLLPALPVAYELHRKGARFTVVVTFLGAVGIARVPMVLFESAFLGWKFSIFRLIVSIPIVIFSSIAMGRYFDKKGYALPKDSAG